VSLINDALKRAQQAQQPAPPPGAANLKFQPIDTSNHTFRAHRRNQLLLSVLALACLASLILVWGISTRNSRALAAAERAKAAAQQAQLASRAAEPVAQPPVAPVLVTASAPSSVVAAASPHSAATTSQANVAAAVTSQSPPAGVISSAPSSTDASPVSKVTPKLQGIIFDPNRPSVLIAGKTLFLGDKFGDLRVVAIDQQSATLAGQGQTNVLTLAP
jgi:hypothetical protein